MFDDDLPPPSPPPADWPHRLLAFWFDSHGMDDWYGGGADFDTAGRDLAADCVASLLRPF